MTVAELLRRIDSQELSEWMAYYNVEPFGDWRADLRAGVISSTIANIHRGKDADPFKPTDFMPLHETKHDPRAQAKKLRASLAHLVKK